MAATLSESELGSARASTPLSDSRVSVTLALGTICDRAPRLGISATVPDRALVRSEISELDSGDGIHNQNTAAKTVIHEEAINAYRLIGVL